MGLFDNRINFNSNVFQKYLRKIPNLKLNTMLKSGVLKENNSLKSRLVDGVGGNILTEPIKGLVDGDYVNYDGKTNITATSRDTFIQRKIVVGRAKGFTEKDFSTDISGEDYLPVAQEIAEYWQGVDMETILAILKGVFSMTKTEAPGFVENHTYEIESKIDATTINNACQKAFGDKKKFVSMAFMHSAVATTLENLQILEYLKYTDSQGIQSNMMIAQQGNKLVIIDDDMPMQSGYYLATAETPNALKVTASGSGSNEITQANVKKGDFYPATLTNDTTYVVAGEKYTTYLLGKGAIEYCDIGAKVPSEMDRDPATNGGETTLFSRQRKLYAPEYISWKGADSIVSPTKEELATGTNWELVNNGNSGAKKYIDPKLVPLGRIITRG